MIIDKVDVGPFSAARTSFKFVYVCAYPLAIILKGSGKIRIVHAQWVHRCGNFWVILVNPQSALDSSRLSP